MSVERKRTIRGQLNLLEPNDVTDERVDAALRVWFDHVAAKHLPGMVANESYRLSMAAAISAASKALSAASRGPHE